MTPQKFLENLGFNEILRRYQKEKALESLSVGRVVLEHRERYIVATPAGEIDSELIGNLRYTAETRADLPAVGDWVALNVYDHNKGLIHDLFPRRNVLERQAIGQFGQKQIIASNIDYGIIMQGVNRDFSVNRLERYITICHAAQMTPIIVLNKIDLIEAKQLHEMTLEIQGRIKGVELITMSNETQMGLDRIKQQIEQGKTYCLLGSSGVGKSTLLNHLKGSETMKTAAISENIDRGKHTTTHRQLFVLESGGVIIDNPGMREVGVTDQVEALGMTFEQIFELAKGCKFNDCSHSNEKRCAVLEALERGELNTETYMNFLKLEKEQSHFSATIHEKRRKDKAFGKMVKQVMNQKKKNRF